MPGLPVCLPGGLETGADEVPRSRGGGVVSVETWDATESLGIHQGVGHAESDQSLHLEPSKNTAKACRNDQTISNLRPVLSLSQTHID